MKFTTPIPFAEAIDKLGSRSIIGSLLNSEQWSRVPLALRESADFSAQVESVRVLQSLRDGVMEYVTAARETLANGQTALATGSRAQFVKQQMDQLASLGIVRTTGTVTDIASEKRLGLIFDTRVRQAQDFGHWQQGQDPDALDAFPAQRFVRTEDRKEHRDLHSAEEGVVRLKTDVGYWTALNQDFGVPWGPWGWGCGHDVEDVSRDEAEALGLIEPGQTLAPIERDFNAGLQASARGLDPDMLEVLQQSFGDQIEIDGDAVKWKG